MIYGFHRSPLSHRIFVVNVREMPTLHCMACAACRWNLNVSSPLAQAVRVRVSQTPPPPPLFEAPGLIYERKDTSAYTAAFFSAKSHLRAVASAFSQWWDACVQRQFRHKSLNNSRPPFLPASKLHYSDGWTGRQPNPVQPSPVHRAKQNMAASARAYTPVSRSVALFVTYWVSNSRAIVTKHLTT